MSTKNDLAKLLELLIEQEGVVNARKSLASLIQDNEKPALTIIANLGSHRIPERYLRGEVYVASEGSFDFSTRSKVISQFQDILRGVHKKLMERTWGRIFLIPTGHVTLSLQIKMLVYRVTRRSTIDVFYSDGKFFDIEIDLRKKVQLIDAE